ncbi:hypothetical protein F2Q70_00012066 [Brassica cretica]|uniref:Uncharacterized protein n=1 Tax=Brassica cretica TaxID=69181 RepID=A0A8S9MA03_BRACR|nr:hypothetical protein F2Q70_00012066 [Brassica cretica]
MAIGPRASQARSLRSDRARAKSRSLRRDLARAKARSLRSDRARDKARLLSSDRARIRLDRYVATKHAHGSAATDRACIQLGRYVATKLEPKLGRYVGIKLDPSSVATYRPSTYTAWSLRSDRALHAFLSTLSILSLVDRG